MRYQFLDGDGPFLHHIEVFEKVRQTEKKSDPASQKELENERKIKKDKLIEDFIVHTKRKISSGDTKSSRTIKELLILLEKYDLEELLDLLEKNKDVIDQEERELLIYRLKAKKIEVQIETIRLRETVAAKQRLLELKSAASLDDYQARKEQEEIRRLEELIANLPDHDDEPTESCIGDNCTHMERRLPTRSLPGFVAEDIEAERESQFDLVFDDDHERREIITRSERDRRREEAERQRLASPDRPLLVRSPVRPLPDRRPEEAERLRRLAEAERLADAEGFQKDVEVLMKYFKNEFERRYHKDMSTKPRAMSRLRTSCERLMSDLTSTSTSYTLDSLFPIELDSLFEGKDLFSNITRRKFLQIRQEAEREEGGGERDRRREEAERQRLASPDRPLLVRSPVRSPVRPLPDRRREEAERLRLAEAARQEAARRITELMTLIISSGRPNWFQGVPRTNVNWTAGGWMFVGGQWVQPTNGWMTPYNPEGVNYEHPAPTLAPPLEPGDWYWHIDPIYDNGWRRWQTGRRRRRR